MTTTHTTYTSDVLVIGSGAAGLRAAIAVHEAGQDVVIVGKRTRRDAHTVLAAGGINAALGTVDSEDSWQQHFADTLKEGYLLSDPRTVELMAREAPQAIEELVSYGVKFAQTPDGKIDQRYFGAHKYRRTAYVGDSTGRAVLYGLADQAEKLNLPIHENQYVSQLLVKDGICFGAMSFNLHSGERTVYLANAVVLAAGGHTRLWRRSSSRALENTGDGMYLALAAGGEISDMELVQFHPTGMVAPESMLGTLVTEAVRGEGGHLYNADGERYMSRYDAERMELSTRDRVALANYTEIVEGRGGPNGGVFLDISHRPKSYILEKLPRMYQQFMDAQNIDISETPMEVAPTAHYTMGGVVVQPDTHATSIVGLYAAGEVTSGLHGANRLGGNSLAETVVFGRHAGAAAASFAQDIHQSVRSEGVIRAAHDDLNRMAQTGSTDSRDLMQTLRDVMWENCGVVRTEEKLQLGLQRLQVIEAAMPDVNVKSSLDLAQLLDLRASIVSAEATVRGALERRESRGAHQRTDYPDIDERLNLNFVTRMDADGTQILSTQNVPPVPADLLEWLNEEEEFAIEGRLLE